MIEPPQNKQRPGSGSNAPSCSAFRVVHRNPGHWDIYTDGGRDYIIRSEPGNVTAECHSSRPMEILTFKSVPAAMAWITDRLMSEPNDERIRAGKDSL